MSRNGSGTYNLPAGNPVVTGTTISSTWANNTLSDMATALTQSIAYDGQTTPVANLPMGTYAHTNVGNATARTMYASAGQVEDGTLNYLTSVSGTNAITATAPVSMSAYVAGQTFRFIAAGANTGAVTLNLNAIGAKAVTRDGTTALVTGDILAGGVYQVTYDGTQFQLTNSSNASVQVTSFSAGTTGLTPNTATTGAITLAGTLNVANGGTGLTSLTSGYIPYGNGTSALSSSSSFVFNGTNLGVGTSSPSTKLQVTVAPSSAADDGMRVTDGTRIIQTNITGSAYSYIGIGASETMLYSTGNPLNIVSDGQPIKFIAGNAERMRIDSSGNVGIGTSSPNAKLEVYGQRIRINSASDPGIEFANTVAVKGYVFYDTTNNLMTMRHASSSGINCDSSGNVLVGTTSNLSANCRLVGYGASSLSGVGGFAPSGSAAFIGKTDSTSGYLAYWLYNSTNTGSITTNGTTTAYNITSDYRLKENIIPLTGALDKIAQLKPSTYNYKSDPSTQIEGFIAHELQEVVPHAVTGEKDATREEEYEITPAIPAVLDEEGNIVEEAVPAVMGTRIVPVYQGVDASFLIPHLVAAIQELSAKVTALEAQLTK